MIPLTVVTGMGIISPIGRSVAEFSGSLRSGRCGIGPLTAGPGISIPVDIGAEITDLPFQDLLRQYENKDNGIPEDFVRKAMLCSYDAPRGVQVSVLSTLEAWRQARLFQVPVNPCRVGIVVSGSNLNPNYSYGFLPKFRQNPQYLTPKYAIHYMDTDHVGTVSEIFQVQGEGFTVGGSSASGNAAIIKGCQMVQLELVDVCIVVGALADLSPMEFQGFFNVGAMGGKRFRDRPGKACRPFDKDHEGFIYGQAGGCLVLESVHSAEKRKVPVLAGITGTSLVLDGNRLPNPGEDGEVRAMESALEQAGIIPGNIDYINAHGSSSPLGDKTEIQAIKRVFKDRVSRTWLNSTKGLTGHCLTAAGVIESIATIIQMREGFVHPNLNLENPIDDVCRFSKVKAVKASIGMALKNSFGFGGINTSIIFKRISS